MFCLAAGLPYSLRLFFFMLLLNFEFKRGVFLLRGGAAVRIVAEVGGGGGMN